MKNKSRTAWICLIAAGLIEIVWAYFMKQSDGFTRPVPTIITVAFLILSFFLLERGIRLFGIGMSYAVFTGIGIAGTTIIGIVLLDEGISVAKIVSLAVLSAGIIGLRFCENAENTAEDGGERQLSGSY